MSFQRTYTAQDLIGAARHQKAVLQREIGIAEHYRAIHHQRRTEAEQWYAKASHDLARALLPGLTREQLERLAALTGYQRPLADDALGALEGERASLTRRIAAIEADPRFAQRELLRHPRTGSLTRALAELEELMAPLRGVIERCAHPRTERLLESGYGTPAYDTGFWRLSYFRDWEAGDAILERFPEKALFSEVRDDLLRAREAIGPLSSEHARVSAEIAAGAALEQEHAQRREALRTLAARWLDKVRSDAVAFLLGCPPDAIASRLKKDAEVELLYKRCAGLRAKVRYMDEIFAHQVQAFTWDAKKAIAKLDKDIGKYSRPKKWHTRFAAPAFEKRFRDRTSAYQKRWQRFEKTYTRVYTFDRYDRAVLDRNLLWWDVLTDGRVNGAYIPEVHQFYRQRPGFVYTRRRGADDHEVDDALEAADAAGVIGDPVDGLLDPS